ncbi:unnamed protein product [Brassica oleracea var. botrytis]
MGVRMLLLDGKLIPLLCRRQKERKGGSTRRVLLIETERLSRNIVLNMLSLLKT